MRNESIKYKKFSRRALIIGGLKLFFFSMIAGRYYYLQMMTSSKFTTLSDKNRLKIIVLTAPRGIIYDRNNKIIANNSSNFKIGIDSLAIPNVSELISQISNILGGHFSISNEELKRKILKRQPNDYLFLKDNLSWQEINKLIESDHILPGAEVLEYHHRSYNFPEAFAHITGYVSSPNKQEIETLSMPASEDMKVGKTGIEKTFNDTLMGFPGLKKTEVDARGKFIRVISTDNPILGRNLTLSVDSTLQNYVHQFLTSRGLVGSIVVMDAKNGNILALHSTPSFNPNLFVDGISREDWEHITNAHSNPLINHAISSAYPPGSIFKLVVSFAALIEGFNSNTRYPCSGEFSLGSRIAKCWKPTGHGSLNLIEAIEQSCNPYFYNLGLQIGIDKIHTGAKLLGFGERTGIELLGEVDGLLPNAEWKKKRYNLDWYPGDTINTSIGQGFVLATLIQIATMTARIASGNIITPTLVPTQKTIRPMDVNPEVFKIIRTGMFNCVNKPTGILYNRHLSIGNFTISGKTGTAQVVALKYKTLGHHTKHHGLFTSYAPYHDPRYVVSVLVEHGEAGSRVSPIAKEIYEFMLQNGFDAT